MSLTSTLTLPLYGLLHKSIRDADYKTMEELVADDPSLLWQRNSIGWTALHFAASHGLGTVERWKWFIGLAAQDGKGTQLYLNLTDAGDSPLTHFFLRELNPLPWQRPEIKNEAHRRRRSIEKVLEDEEMLDCVRERFDSNPLPSSGICSVCPLSQDMMDVLDFLLRLNILLDAAFDQSALSKQWSVLHSLALTGCPRLVAHLVIRLYPEQLTTKDENGNLPLHLAASSTTPQSHHMLLALIESRPETCSQQDAQKHLPLHLALSAGVTYDVVQWLWKANPLYGAPLDVVSSLPAFLIAAIGNDSTRRHKTFQVAARSAMWRFLPSHSRQRALDQAREEVELEELTTVYVVLMASPDALSCMMHL